MWKVARGRPDHTVKKGMVEKSDYTTRVFQRITENQKREVKKGGRVVGRETPFT